AMASRAPLDLRVNTLKAKREKVLASLRHLGAEPTPWSPIGLRIALGADARNPGIHAEEDFIKGAVEVQDEGSQLAALFSAAKPGEQVIDPCTGAGTWRRNPDAKWRMRPGALEVRLKDQAEVLDRAAALVKPGGRIAYVTCSVLRSENGDQIRSFVSRHPAFSIQPLNETAS